jgi:hypothetical protein
MKQARILLSVGSIAALVLIGTRPAAGAAISIVAAFQYEQADAGLVQRVHRKWGKRAHSYQDGCYAGYLPFGYRPNMYYGCPGYGWPYWRPPEQELVPRSGALNDDFRESSPRQPGEQPVTFSQEAAPQPGQRLLATSAEDVSSESTHLSNYQKDLALCLKWARLGTLVCRKADGTAETFNYDIETDAR